MTLVSNPISYETMELDNEPIEAETKWPPFSRRNNQAHFLERKLLYFDENVIEICSPWSN